MKQQFVDRHVVPLDHIILISSQPIFALSSRWLVLSREETNTNLIVFGLMGAWTSYLPHSGRVEHANYTTDEVITKFFLMMDISETCSEH